MRAILLKVGLVVSAIVQAAGVVYVVRETRIWHMNTFFSTYSCIMLGLGALIALASFRLFRQREGLCLLLSVMILAAASLPFFFGKYWYPLL